MENETNEQQTNETTIHTLMDLVNGVLIPEQRNITKRIFSEMGLVNGVLIQDEQSSGANYEI